MASNNTNIATLEMMEDALLGHRTSAYSYESPVETISPSDMRGDGVYQFNYGVAFWDWDIDTYIDENGVEHQYFDGNPGEVVVKYFNTLREAEVELSYLEDRYKKAASHYVVELPNAFGWELIGRTDLEGLEIRELKPTRRRR